MENSITLEQNELFEDIENKDQGFILIYRSILQKSFMQDTCYLSIWVHLLLLANHTERFVNGIKIERGSFLTSRKVLSTKTGIEESKIERILLYLENEQQIKQQKTNKYRIISIINYDRYQKSNNKLNNNKQQKTTKQQQKTQLNNDNNEKELKQIYGEFANVFLTLEEKQKLLEKMGNEQKVNKWIEDLSSYIKRKGKEKEYKSHYAVIVKWGKDDIISQVKKNDAIKRDENGIRPIPKFED